MVREQSEGGRGMDEAKAKTIYFLSGIGTWREGNMFSYAMDDVASRYQLEGFDRIHTLDLYPYGSMDNVPPRNRFRKLARQAAKVSRDMYARYHRNEGGRRAFLEIVEDYDRIGEGEIILIGHSGGGVAAYNTSQLLSEQGYPVDQVILVGSPEQWISKEWQNRVHSLRKTGRFGDLVTWWGRPCFGAPKQNDVVPILGGHPDYFRKDLVDESGIPNVTKVMDKIWQWIRPGQAGQGC